MLLASLEHFVEVGQVSHLGRTCFFYEKLYERTVEFNQT